MAIHYNAFISYRHHPDDIRVASDIHRSLERFRVPKEIRRQGKEIARLFRDKDELPITSSLTDDIYEALENSDYLIVICSVHTRESVWVQREIETFLKTHPRNRVLTVLASGEPYDVIPEILLREEVTDPVTGQTRWVDIEPLSCDWRMKRKIAVREELPRLAAALLGCGYDDLRQRQRQYRMRRTVAGFSVALAASLALSAYFLQTSIRIQKANEDLQAANIQIRENLDQALRNQSEYLASVSQERMAAGDRLTAIALALEALPDGDGDRPYVPSAEYALSDALNSYQSQTNTSAVGALEADSAVNHFRVTDDGKQLYVLDTRGLITVWDTATFRRLSLIDASEHNPAELVLTPGGNVLFQSRIYESPLMCYGPDGAFRWQIPYCTDVAFAEDGQTLMILENDYSGGMRVLFVDPETGVECRDAVVLSDGEYGAAVRSFGQASFASGTEVILCGTEGVEDLVLLLDRQTGALRELLRLDTSFEQGGRSIEAVSAVDADTVLIMVSDGSGIYNGNYGTFQIYSPSKAEILCQRLSTGETLWRREIVTYIYSNEHIMEPIPGTEQILCQRGNTFQVVDRASGQLVMECQTPAKPVTVKVDSDAVWGILENGQFYEYQFADGRCSTTPMLDGTVTWAQVKNGAFLLTPLSSQVQVYRSVRDDRGSTLEGDYNLGISTVLRHGTDVALMDSNGIYLFDMEHRELVWNANGSYLERFLGFSDDGTMLWIWNKVDKTVRCIRTDDAQESVIPVPVELDGRQGRFSSDVFCSSEKLYYVLSAELDSAIIQVDLVSGAVEKWMLPSAETVEYGDIMRLLGGDGFSLWFWQKDGQVLRLGMEEGTVDPILTDVSACPVAAWEGETGGCAMAVGHEAILFSSEGTEQVRFSLEDRKAVSLYFRSGELLALCDDGTLWRYDRQGTMLSKTGLMIYNTFSGKVSNAGMEDLEIFWYETADGALILNALGAGNLVDCTQWQCRAFIDGMKTYLPETDEILCLSGGKICSYHPYSTGEQMDYARQLLGDYELSEEDRAYYGIG